MNATIKNLFNKIHPIGTETWNSIIEICELKTINKSVDLIKKGKLFRYEVLLVNGTLRSYSIDGNGQEYTTGFYTSGDFISPFFIRQSNKESTFYIQAAEKSEIALFDEEKFTLLRWKYDDLFKLGLNVVDKEIDLRSYKGILLSKRNLFDKYLFFREKFAFLESKVSQRHVASYIGADPVSLSRMKTEMHAKALK